MSDLDDRLAEAEALIAKRDESVQQMRDHRHPPSPQSDIFCLNISAWLGETEGAFLHLLRAALSGD